MWVCAHDADGLVLKDQGLGSDDFRAFDFQGHPVWGAVAAWRVVAPAARLGRSPREISPDRIAFVTLRVKLSALSRHGFRTGVPFSEHACFGLNFSVGAGPMPMQLALSCPDLPA